MGEMVPFSELATTDLTVDAAYAGGTAGNASDDPLGKMIPVGNQGGFRYSGSVKDDNVRICVLYSSGADLDWPDSFDPESGVFTYFGDNRRPGKDLHDTSRNGNRILRSCFGRLHGAQAERESIPPFLVFTRASQDEGRAVRFLGLAVPGSQSTSQLDDLVAVWRTTDGKRFQNYQATFTILDVPTVSRDWLEAIIAGDHLGPACPKPFRDWVETGKYEPLEAPGTIHHRTKAEQVPNAPGDRALLNVVYEYFADDPHQFEACAIELWRMLAPAPTAFVATRRSADGGRDAYGWLFLGPTEDKIRLEWSLEAKLSKPGGSGAGVKQTSRLISRLRHREFGVFVTTNHVARQAYEELRLDQQPVVVIAGNDIVALLKKHGHSTPKAVKTWLEDEFPDLGD